MQNQNPYGQLTINPANYAQIVPNPQQQNFINVQQQVQYPQSYPNQQPMIVYQPFPVDPQLVVDSKLIQFQNPKSKKRFSMLIAFICLIQTIMMLYSALMIQQLDSYRQFFNQNGYLQWPSYIIVLATIAAVIAGRLCKLPKDRFIQGCLLVGMTILWTMFAGVISTAFGSYYFIYYVYMLIYNGLAYVGILTTYALIQPHQQNNIFGQYVTKLILIVYLLPMGIMSFILIFAAGPYGFIAVIFILMIGVVGMIWSSVVGFAFLFSLAQILQGKFELEMNDFVAGAILVYSNMVPF